jgi:hypothetical protein
MRGLPEVALIGLKMLEAKVKVENSKELFVPFGVIASKTP